MIGVLLTALGTFLVTVPWGERLIAYLQLQGAAKQIRADGPQTHEVKRGTPTMGGVLIVAPVLLIGVLLALRTPRLWAPLAVTLAFAGLGTVDDLRGLRDVQGVGWLARYKLPWQLALGFLGALALYAAGAPRSVYVPLLNRSVFVGLGYIPIAAVAIAAMANAVNFTDGLDGQASGTAVTAFAAYAVIALVALPSAQTNLAALCAAFVGGLLAFLWYNAHPARVFMGDIGSQALGAGLAAVALCTDQWLLLPLIGGVFTAELLSDVLQVGYFKWTHGRRLLRMAPLHHHFELGGWPETQVAIRFWIISAVLALLGLALAVMR